MCRRPRVGCPLPKNPCMVHGTSRAAQATKRDVPHIAKRGTDRWHQTVELGRMVGLVSENLDRIRAACARRGVSFLELVGSASRDDFDATRSDIDVLVDFPDDAPDLFGAYMGLREDLAEILGRPVDVITLRGIRNHLLLESLRRVAVRLYAA